MEMRTRKVPAWIATIASRCYGSRASPSSFAIVVA